MGIRVEFTDRECEAVLHIIERLAIAGRACGWTVIEGARVDGLESATNKLHEAREDAP